MAFEVDPRTLLNKLAFGPSDAELHSIAKVGADGWLAQQLNPPVEDDCAQRIASTHIRLKYSSKTPEAEVDEDRRSPCSRSRSSSTGRWSRRPWRPGADVFRTAVACATTIRAVHSRWQLREVLVDFWHNHFNVNAVGDNLIAVALPTYDNEVIRRHAWATSASCWRPSLKVPPCRSTSTTGPRAAARPTRTMRASCSSCIRSAGRPISTRFTTAGATFPARPKAGRRVISTRTSMKPPVPSPAGRSRMAPESAPGDVCR